MQERRNASDLDLNVAAIDGAHLEVVWEMSFQRIIIMTKILTLVLLGLFVFAGQAAAESLVIGHVRTVSGDAAHLAKIGCSPSRRGNLTAVYS